MKCPMLDNIPSQKKQIIDFRGYNHNPHIKDGEMYDMANLTSSLYPVLSPRKPRGTVQELIKPNGLFAKNALAWVDGTEFFYNGVKQGDVADSAKQFVSMGAYILIFPDNKFYNTADDTFGSLENTYTQSTQVTYSPCLLDGTAGDSTSLYCKISATGINTGFKQHDGVILSGSSIAAVNGKKIIQNIGTDYIIISAKGIATQTQDAGISITRTVPQMDFIAENNNRVWGCSSSNHEVYASKLGDPFNWNCYEGISTDSYAATIGSDGDFTGAISYGGYILFFKEDRIHKVHGSKPSNFQIYETECRGIASGSEKSAAVVNETLFYMSRSGIMAYNGGSPASVSDAFGDVTYSDAVAGALNDKYYVSMKDSKNIWHLFVYDEKSGMWHREDNTHASYFAYLDGILYFITGTKLMQTAGGDSEVIKWYAEFSDYSEKTMNKKYVSKLQFRADLEPSTIFDIWIMYDGIMWEKISSLAGYNKRSYNVMIPMRRCESYKIKLSGVGDFKLYSMTKVITEGSDL